MDTVQFDKELGTVHEMADVWMGFLVYAPEEIALSVFNSKYSSDIRL